MFGLRSLVNRSHAHCPATLLISLDGPFSLRIEDGPKRMEEAVLIAPNVRRETSAPNTRLVDVLIDPHTKLFERLAGSLSDPKVVSLEPSVLAPILPSCAELFDGELNVERANRLLEDLVSAIEQPPGSRLDSRVLAAISAIWRLLPDNRITAEGIAAQVGLSGSRLLHLFSEQTGSTFRQYVLWLRIRLAMNLWAENQAIADIAVGAGFCDQSHFTKTLRRMTDFAPSTLANSGQYQCVDCTRTQGIASGSFGAATPEMN